MHMKERERETKCHRAVFEGTKNKVTHQYNIQEHDYLNKIYTEILSNTL